MDSNRFIPVAVIRKDLADIEARLGVLKDEAARIRQEEARLIAKQSILTEIEQKAVAASSIVNPQPKTASASQVSVGQGASAEDIPNGRVATPIVLQVIRERPGIKSTELIDILHLRVNKKVNKGPRRFLADLLWELGHRKKLKRHEDGSLYLPEQGGES